MSQILLKMNFRYIWQIGVLSTILGNAAKVSGYNSMNFSQTSLCHLYNIQLHLYSIQGYMKHFWILTFCTCTSQYDLVWHISMPWSDQLWPQVLFWPQRDFWLAGNFLIIKKTKLVGQNIEEWKRNKQHKLS